MKYSLSSDEMCEILACFAGKKAIDDDILRLRYDSAIAWQGELLALTYIFVRVALKRDRRWYYVALADLFYDLEEGMWVTLEDVGPSFVEFLLTHVRDREVEFEEQLRVVHEEYEHHCYGNSVRLRYVRDY